MNITWFKHDANAHRDTKLKKLRLRYGLQGYGLYFYCLEQITDNINLNNLTFRLEDDAEIMAHDLGIHVDEIQDMMTYMVDLKLFESSDGIITCLKLAKRLDSSQTSNPKMRELIKKIKESPDNIMTLSGQHHDNIMTTSGSVMQDKRDKIDKREKEQKKPAPKKKTFQKPSIQECFEHCKNQTESESFFNYYESNGWKVGRNKMVNWKSSLTNWVKRSQDFNPSSANQEPDIKDWI